MSVPSQLDQWTLSAIQHLVEDGSHESDLVEFKEVLVSQNPKYNGRVLKAACSLANTRGGFMVFGISENGEGAERLVGIPESRENQKVLADKLAHAEPSLRFSVGNPQLQLANGNVLLVAEILPADRGPHWYHDRGEPREFWRRSQGRAVRMTHSEIQSAFTNYAERVSRIHLVYLSLIDNLERLSEMASYGPRATISLTVVEMSQIRQHLSELSSLCPEAVGPVLRILRTGDSVTASLQALLPVLHLGLSDRDELVARYNQEMSTALQLSRSHFKTVLELLYEQFEFDPVVTSLGTIPPLP